MENTHTHTHKQSLTWQSGKLSCNSNGLRAQWAANALRQRKYSHTNYIMTTTGDSSSLHLSASAQMSKWIKVAFQQLGTIEAEQQDDTARAQEERNKTMKWTVTDQMSKNEWMSLYVCMSICKCMCVCVHCAGESTRQSTNRIQFSFSAKATNCQVAK